MREVMLDAGPLCPRLLRTLDSIAPVVQSPPHRSEQASQRFAMAIYGKEGYRLIPVGMPAAIGSIMMVPSPG
jgi:hypothetical protein